MSPEEFIARADQIARFITDYTENAERYPPIPPTSPGDVFNALPAHAPEQHEPFENIWNDVLSHIVPNTAHWQHPGWYAFFSANSSYPAILADLLSTGLAAQGMLWKTSPALTETETRTLDALAHALGLPHCFLSTQTPDHSKTSREESEKTGGTGGTGGGGVIHSTASEATLCALVAARHREQKRLVAVGQSPHDLRPTIYTSTQAHSSVIKAAMIAGLAHNAEDRTFVRTIETDNQLRLDPAALEHAITQDIHSGLHPTFLCATLGTTATGAFDPLDQLAPIARRQNLWLHADAAWAGAALVCPELRHFATGLEHADSLCINPHKWLLTNFDLDVFYVKDRQSLINSLSITPEYLRNDATDRGVIDYRDWQIPLGRRFRSLKLLFVLRHYGLTGLRAHIRQHINLAQHLETQLQTNPNLQLPLPRALALTCFRIAPAAAASINSDPDTLTRQLLDRLNATNNHYLTHAAIPLPDQPKHNATIIRVNIGSPSTQQRHIDRLIADINKLTAQLLTP